MNRYLCFVYSILGPSSFEVNATDEEDALFVAKQYLERSPIHQGHYRPEDIRVIRKLPKKGKLKGVELWDG